MTYVDRFANEKDADLRGMESSYSQMLKEDAVRYECYHQSVLLLWFTSSLQIYSVVTFDSSDHITLNDHFTAFNQLYWINYWHDTVVCLSVRPSLTL